MPAVSLMPERQSPDLPPRLGVVFDQNRHDRTGRSGTAVGPGRVRSVSGRCTEQQMVGSSVGSGAHKLQGLPVSATVGSETARHEE
ncbi:hypothetical protein [Methylobacterium sp. NEAU K]|uniref:hypothetical protein n=1 Tax=Methylobacterium sp. NEAU K TaxID=3064946 RepID=UPI002732B3B0|nr:hypothetical protein [Methylobacterium sp. NEAU K]MDP4002900.1 hypothetical protein [Methylobacterium sp. NEAU K]